MAHRAPQQADQRRMSGDLVSHDRILLIYLLPQKDPYIVRVFPILSHSSSQTICGHPGTHGDLLAQRDRPAIRSTAKKMSKAISRVMSLDGHLSRTAVTSSLQQPTREQTGRLTLPVWSCFGWGLQSPACYQAGGSLLHCLSTLTARGQRYISVALSLESPPPDVIWHPAL